jgi:hypothetical protein
MAGDVAIYVDSEGDISHSGVVMRVEVIAGVRTIYVLSKWGECQEVIHLVGDCPYTVSKVEYWRVVR